MKKLSSLQLLFPCPSNITVISCKLGTFLSCLEGKSRENSLSLYVRKSMLMVSVFYSEFLSSFLKVSQRGMKGLYSSSCDLSVAS